MSGKQMLIAEKTCRTSTRVGDYSSSCGNRGGFTLIELLVVISIVALLTAVLMPTLARVRLRAKSIRCQNNLHQLGVNLWSMAAEAGSFAGARAGDDWLLSRGQEKGLLCPLATKILWETFEEISNNGGRGDRGARFAAWGYRWVKDGVPGNWGSYGINPYAFQWSGGGLPGDFFRRFWLPAEAEGRADVPLFLDCISRGCGADHNDVPPPEDDAWVRDSRMSDYCINRHQGFINGLFCDSSVRKVGLKELWTLKWHKQFDTAGPWTRGGGAQSVDWPQWMRNFKDY